MAKLKLGIVNSTPLSVSYGGVAPFIKNLDPFMKEAFDVEYVLLPASLVNIKIIPRRLLFLLYLLGKRKKLRSFDVVLSHVPEGSWVVSFAKVPYIHIFHGNFNPMSQSRYWYGKYFMKVFAAMEKRVIRTASLMYTVGVERGPRIPKIFNPVYHSVAPRPYDQRSGFIFSGRLEKIKNIDRIIQIYAQLPATIQNDNHLHIAGMGTQDAYLKELAKELGVAEKVHFLGNLPNDVLIETDSTKKILVMASTQEGMPMAIAEAFSLGVPVISTDTGDIARVVKSDYNGFLLPLDFKDETYLKCIETILNDYDRFSKNALASAEMFRAEKVAESLTNDIYKIPPRK